METKDLLLERKNGWDLYGNERKAEIFAFANDYKKFLNHGKTERECVNTSIEILRANGYKEVNEYETLKAGDKVYQDIRGKGLVAAVIGEEPLENGLNILGAHIDSPRIDLKPMPLYEDSDMAYLKTHYYGGIKKYQWTTIPLALHGVAFNQKGEKIEFCIGEKEEDPIFVINELLIHLSQEQMTRKAAEAIKGEELNLLVGSIPLEKDEESKIKDRVKVMVLQYLYDTYGMIEKDLISAEIEIVPAIKARDIGFDRGMLGAYGQDDRVCGYTSLRALVDIQNPKKTCVCLLSDKEEIGSCGNTGAQSRSYENVLRRIMAKVMGHYDELTYVECIEHSKMLSSDVTAAYEPSFASAYEKANSTFASYGVGLMKYTGRAGKGGCNDANSEFFYELTKAYDAAGIVWQTGEIGRVDLGGGGTIACYMANLGMQVIDCGVPVLSMHAPMEVTSKVDIYAAYEGYKVFLNI